MDKLASGAAKCHVPKDGHSLPTRVSTSIKGRYFWAQQYQLATRKQFRF